MNDHYGPRFTQIETWGTGVLETWNGGPKTLKIKVSVIIYTINNMLNPTEYNHSVNKFT